nr:MAG TPA: hypothetical protein [Caudoviricetes sp.]
MGPRRPRDSQISRARSDGAAERASRRPPPRRRRERWRPQGSRWRGKRHGRGERDETKCSRRPSRTRRSRPIRRAPPAGRSSRRRNRHPSCRGSRARRCEEHEPGRWRRARWSRGRGRQYGGWCCSLSWPSSRVVAVSLI